MVPGYKEALLTLTEYRRNNIGLTGQGPAVLHMHGGGMFTGGGELYAPLIQADVRATGVPHYSMYVMPSILSNRLLMLVLK